MKEHQITIEEYLLMEKIRFVKRLKLDLDSNLFWLEEELNEIREEGGEDDEI